MEKWVLDRVDVYLRHGGKTSRRATVKRLLTILADVRQHEPGIRMPPQVGRAHLHRYWARHAHLAAPTLRDHWYSLVLLWELLGRSGEPPRPPQQEETQLQTQIKVQRYWDLTSIDIAEGGGWRVNFREEGDPAGGNMYPLQRFLKTPLEDATVGELQAASHTAKTYARMEGKIWAAALDDED